MRNTAQSEIDHCSVIYDRGKSVQRFTTDDKILKLKIIQSPFIMQKSTHFCTGCHAMSVGVKAMDKMFSKTVDGVDCTLLKCGCLCKADIVERKMAY